MFNIIKYELVIIIAIFCCSTFLHSQSPRIQMPYGLGNVWILYMSQYESIRWTYIDTNYVIDSIKYSVLTYMPKYSGPKSKLDNASIPYFYARIREDGYHVEKLDTSYPSPHHEWIHWKENPQIGDRWENEPLPGSIDSWQYKILDKAYLPIFNTWDTIYALKMYNFPGPYELIANYSQRFGIVSTSAEFETAFLKGCVIGGVVYGDTTFFTTDIEDEDDLPNEYWLKQNYPNPFNPITHIQYSLPKSGYVMLTIYDMLGIEVMKLVDGEQSAGNYTVEFDGCKLSSGIYFYELKAGEFTQTRKMIVAK